MASNEFADIRNALVSSSNEGDAPNCTSGGVPVIDRALTAAQLAHKLRYWACLGLLGAGAIFTFVPSIDISVAHIFYGSDLSFVGNTPTVEALRDIFKLIYVLSCVAALAGFVYTHKEGRTFRGLCSAQYLFLLTCLAVGPGVVTNLALKDEWGRARPREIVEFGGTKAFTPALVPSRECHRNCSFVAGEPSSMFMIFFAAAFIFTSYWLPLLGMGISAGALTGLIRIAQGGHFLSDVVFAGIAMALTAALTYSFFETIHPGVLERKAEGSA
ncbi:MAG: phosphatase PAP2 family protein [Hyphomicrobiaceae bacterium]|nr:phosphatase PAP2 family protein [Hyphomicrobiaceae bacterium]